MGLTSIDSTLGDLVARNYRAAVVLNELGLDFCCGGKRTVADACRGRQLDPAEVAAAIDRACAEAPPMRADAEWDLGELVAHITDTHHLYVRAAVPRILGYLHKLVEVHGARHPELARIAAYFEELGLELRQHMLKEETVLFPYVEALHAAVTQGTAPPANCFGTVKNPIRMMELEHTEAGGALEIIRELSNHFQPPADGCTTYRVCFEELAAFDADLRRHIHLENNVLFPKAVAAERTL